MTIFEISILKAEFLDLEVCIPVRLVPRIRRNLVFLVVFVKVGCIEWVPYSGFPWRMNGLRFELLPVDGRKEGVLLDVLGAIGHAPKALGDVLAEEALDDILKLSISLGVGWEFDMTA